jgi:acetolactate synthase-1/2/3 large subunit
VLSEFHERTGAVDLYVLIDRLAQSTNADDIIVPGSSGACSEVVMQAFQVTEGQRILNSQGLGAMGFGVAAAIGACLASGGRRTITVDGDGGFHMNTQELETVRRLDLPIKFFVLNNQGYASIRATQRNHFDGHFVASDESSGLTLPATAKLAEAFGIPSWIVDGHDQLEKTIDEVFRHPGPALVEVILDRDQATSPRLTSRQLPDGTMVSSPLEDLWPFLDRDELKRNMGVCSTPEADQDD